MWLLELIFELLGDFILHPAMEGMWAKVEERSVIRSLVAPSADLRGCLSFTTPKHPDTVMSAIRACAHRNGYRLRRLSDDRLHAVFRDTGALTPLLITVSAVRRRNVTFVELSPNGRATWPDGSRRLQSCYRLFRSAVTTDA